MNVNGIEEMNKLQAACNARGFFIGLDIDPKRAAKDCTPIPPDIILFVANERPIKTGIILSDTVTEDLATSAKHLLEEVRNYVE